MEAARREYEPQGVGFLAVSVDSDARRIVADASGRAPGLRQSIARGGVMEALDLSVVPATVLVSRDGRIVGVASGPRSRAFFERVARELLESGRAPPETG